MDIGAYRNFLTELVKEALENSDGSPAGISEYIGAKRLGRFLVRNREEKQRALQDAKRAFDEHRHWPIKIIISHLGLDNQDFNY